MLNNIENNFSLLKEYNIDIDNLPVDCDDKLKLNCEDKKIIVEKLLEAHKLACANVKAGNITKRGFATNICTTGNIWCLGTNFNNTRNDISSICGERSAILFAYNNALINYTMQNDFSKPFNFKIKWLCMAVNIDLSEPQTLIAPCEDCLSWLNTNRYFDNEAVIFAFDRKPDGILKLAATRLKDILPYKGKLTSNQIEFDKKIHITKKAQNSMLLNNISENVIIDLIRSSYNSYKNNNYTQVSNQNISASILACGEIFSAYKLDWTKRWHVEPLEIACYKAIEKYSDNVQIQAIAYFGDEFCIKNNDKFNDGVVSIKSLGRIRQKYANSDTLLILNMKDEILATTIGDYLPVKFIQGYKIV